MNIFVVNSGSSSIKYQFFRLPSQDPVCSGLVERIGLEMGSITHKVFASGQEQEMRLTRELPDHEAGLQVVGDLLTDEDIGLIRNPADIEAVGHRVVHGGESFAATTIITPEVKAEIKRLFPLAPLHNPPNYLGIEVAVITTVLKISSTVHPRLRSLTGLLSPWSIGPMARAPVSRCTAL